MPRPQDAKAPKAAQIGLVPGPYEGWPHSVTGGALPPGLCDVSRGNRRRRRYLRGNAGSLRRLLGEYAERFGMGQAVVLGQDLTQAAGTVHDDHALSLCRTHSTRHDRMTSRC